MNSAESSRFGRRSLSFIMIAAFLCLAWQSLAASAVRAEGTATPSAAAGCNAPEMSTEDYAATGSTTPADTPRSYTAAGPASTEDAEAAIATLDQREICRNGGAISQSWSLYTDYGLYWLNTNADNIEGWNDYQLARIDEGFAHSASFDPEARIMTEQDAATPTNASGSTFRTAWFPENAIMLEDGRLAVQTTVILPADSNLADQPLISEVGSAIVLMQVDGEWRIDETLPLCFANCDANRADLENALLVPMIGTPAATPADD